MELPRSRVERRYVDFSALKRRVECSDARRERHQLMLSRLVFPGGSHDVLQKREEVRRERGPVAGDNRFVVFFGCVLEEREDVTEV